MTWAALFECGAATETTTEDVREALAARRDDD
jgi:hypothetical protein